jgi:hypothetical protein
MTTQASACPSCGSTANQPGDQRCRQCDTALAASARSRRRSGGVLGLIGILIGAAMIVAMLYIAGVGPSPSP